jgi:aminoglycoside phosphotransferase (APT) family kinase protein
VAEPRLIAAGRASEVFDLGDGSVLRRFKRGGDPEGEAQVMSHARRHGYPVPAVLEIRTDALVLEKIEGPTMWQVANGKPSTQRVQAELLAQLHRDLHKIVAPDGLTAVGEGDRLLHLDLHPANVILSAGGPIVVDWTNARRGKPAFDVAMTWLIGATSSGQGRLGRSLLSQFLTHFDRAELRHVLPSVADYRLSDENVTDDERRAIQNLVVTERL